MSTSAFYEPFYDIDRFMNEVFHPAEQRIARRGDQGEVVARPFRPRMDLHENEKENLVTANFELPGLTPDQINIEVRDGRLTLSGEIKKPEHLDESGYSLKERRYGKFSRTIQLPQGVKESDIKANIKDGILCVTFPKSTPEMAPKRIIVK